MSEFQAIVLGILQGLTEFIPVSSSGHLAVAQNLFGLQSVPLLYDVLLHFATLLATLVVLRSQVLGLARALFRLPKFARNWFQKGHLAIGDDPEAWTLLLIFVTTVITGSVGVAFHDTFEKAFSTPPVIAAAFSATGFLLFASRNFVRGKGKSAVLATVKDALWIGLAQAFAILPGLSRSGTTLTAALFLGFDRKFAGEYSFLISLPVIAGAALLEIRKGGLDSLNVTWPSAAVGFLASFGLGVLTLRLLLGWIRSGKLTPCAYYCWFAALFTLFLIFRG
ncbi:MAG TPA: undecaprenyl-diphosphate phosphatase [Bdellovibrionota bacterium]|nr:undecaprenyl-diphosphate phosphatase [Bdellovibrionota bacterium]